MLAFDMTARAAGYLLDYQSKEERFLSTWGKLAESLSARGIFGSILGFWTA